MRSFSHHKILTRHECSCILTESPCSLWHSLPVTAVFEVTVAFSPSHCWYWDSSSHAIKDRVGGFPSIGLLPSVLIFVLEALLTLSPTSLQTCPPAFWHEYSFPVWTISHFFSCTFFKCASTVYFTCFVKIWFIICILMFSLNTCLCTKCVHCLHRPEEGVRSFGTGATESYEPPHGG